MSHPFSPKEQIAYIPSHVFEEVQTLSKALKHPDVEFGFVVRDKGTQGVFCRYWLKYSRGELRTKANSELTPREMIVSHISRSPTQVDGAWDQWVEPSKETKISEKL